MTIPFILMETESSTESMTIARIVLNSQTQKYDVSYTKHYYAGDQRINSKLGKGKDVGLFNCGWLIIPFGGGTASVNEKTVAKEKLEANTTASLAIMAKNGITPPPNYGQNAGYTENCVSSYAGEEEKDTYWYHPDHLGSSSFITGLDGEVTQNIEYFPSGEVFVENHKNSYNTPFKFNGKELDDETGYYYYGARYYNPRVSLWLNVDPLMEKYPSWSPYNYALQNPVKFIDPDGRDVIPWFVNSFKSDGSMRMTKNYSTKEFNKAMTDFAKTDYGRNYLLSFMKKGQTIFGLKATESGKNSDSNLNLINLNLEYATGNEKANTFMGPDGATWEGLTVYPSKEENSDINFYFDTNGADKYSLGETIAHEVALHGSHYDEAVNNIKKGDLKSDPSKNDHQALKAKDSKNKAYRNYENTMKQLIKIDEKYKKDAKINEQK